MGVELQFCDFSQHHTGALLALVTLGKDLAPRVYRHAVAPGTAAVFMQTALRRCQHVSEVFNRAGAQQNLPVRQAGGEGKRTGHQQQVGLKRAVQLRKPQVITNAQADAVGVAVNRGQIKARTLAARPDHIGLVEAFGAVVKPEKMHLVITRHTLPVGPVNQRAVKHMRLRGCSGVGLQRQGAAGDPEPELAGAVA